MTRRKLVHSTVAATAAIGAGAGVLASGSTAWAGLTRADPVIDLTFMPWWIHWDAAGTQLLNQAAAHFGREAGHKGLRLTALQGPQGGSASTGGVVTAMLAGQGPDVVADCCGAFVQYLGVGAFENLTPYLQRDNISPSIWSAGHMQALTWDQGQMALPVYDGPVVYAYRQDILDQLGLPYPDPEWTWEDATKLWRQCAGTVQGTKTHRFGAGVPYGTPTANPEWIIGFGGRIMDATRTKCLLNQPAAIAAAQWLMPLYWDKIVENYADDLQTGSVVFQARGGWDVPHDVVNFGNKFKWDYLPVPKYPNGRATFSNNDFWGLSSYSKNKDAAWEVLKWLTAEDYWQEFVMKSTLLEPCKISLWDKWEYYWTQTAPILRTKQIKWYKDAALGGYAYAEEFFKYESAQADVILSNMVTELNNRKTDAAAGFTQAARQVDALEASGPKIAAGQAALLSRSESLLKRAAASATAIAFPAPPKTMAGAGVPPSSGSQFVKVGASGQVTLMAQGSGMRGNGDSGLFAGSPYTSSKGSFTCRLVSVSLPKGGALATAAKIGLMARSSLDQSAATAGVIFAVQHGVQPFARPLIGYNLGDQKNWTATNPTGLIGWQVVQTSNASALPAGQNWLLKPLWLRAVLDGGQWQAYSSLDGKSWTAAGTPEVVEFAGAWVGVFATANSGSQTVQCVFDNIQGFSPSTAVVVGPA